MFKRMKIEDVFAKFRHEGGPDPQGHQANVNGKRLEDRVEATLRKLGVDFVEHREYDPAVFNTEKVGIKNVPHITPYGGQGRHEFDLVNVVPGRVRIECRSQYVSGTADEKLLYLFESVLIGQENVAWIILDGEGFKPGAKATLNAKAAAVKHKKIKVFNSFKHWESWINVVLGNHKLN